MINITAASEMNASNVLSRFLRTFWVSLSRMRCWNGSFWHTLSTAFVYLVICLLVCVHFIGKRLTCVSLLNTVRFIYCSCWIFDQIWTHLYNWKSKYKSQPGGSLGYTKDFFFSVWLFKKSWWEMVRKRFLHLCRVAIFSFYVCVSSMLSLRSHWRNSCECRAAVEWSSK